MKNHPLLGMIKITWVVIETSNRADPAVHGPFSSEKKAETFANVDRYTDYPDSNWHVTTLKGV